ncbi:unnamed protein product [Paramecium sonneborni]|uniref:Uncharacterized protein n=1 Tax=Paramecium sonneborni TaxID=65129 RepID=A0A8S1PTE3_9CILI|nr:unnamed protein product [Paramecium sonneborni]
MNNNRMNCSLQQMIYNVEKKSLFHLKLITQQSYKSITSELFVVAQSQNQEKEIKEFEQDQLFENLIDFSNKQNLLYQLKQKEIEVVLLKNKEAQYEEYDKLKEQYNQQQEEYKIIDDQSKQPLNLSLQ